MSEGSFQSLDLASAIAGLERLFEQVTRGRGRIEITRDGSEEACVLISKSELESFERALEILRSSDSGREMHEQLLRIAGELSLRQPALAAARGVG